MLMKKVKMSDHDFFRLDVAGRREEFLKMEPEFLKLEEKLLKLGGKKLIYMPDMLHPSYFLERGEIQQLEIVENLKHTNMCHAVSQQAAKSSLTKMWTGFYLIDDLWRMHSWVELMDGTKIDVTGNERKLAFGFKLTDEEVEVFDL